MLNWKGLANTRFNIPVPPIWSGMAHRKVSNNIFCLFVNFKFGLKFWAEMMSKFYQIVSKFFAHCFDTVRSRCIGFEYQFQTMRT